MEETVMAKKTTCPISRGDFQSKAKPVQLNIAGVPHLAEVKEFSTGSFGWYLNGRTTIEIDGQPVSVLINTSLIIVGSKEAPGEPAVVSAEKTAEQVA
jgi:hypothetical protein